MPFCRRLCWFCACRTQGTRSEEPVRAYAQVLKAELALLKARLPRGITLSRLHWGGGTPTLLPADEIESLARDIFSVVPLGEDAEFSVEIDPNEIDDARLDALAAAGMNRASIGVQDFDPQVQHAIRRIQAPERVQAALDAAREAGFESVNFDLIYGLPRQSVESFSQTLERVVGMRPGRRPLMACRQVMIPSDAMPKPEERLDLRNRARPVPGRGQEEIGIDHFARPDDGLAVAAREGRLRRNFQGYTDDTAEALIGLGASAISRMPQGYAQNAPATSAYVKAIRDGQFATVKGHAFDREDLLRARLIEALMCDFRIDSDEIRSHFGTTEAHLAELYAAPAREFGDMVQVDPKGFAIPERGRPLTRMIARAFDAYDLSKAGHSSAV